MGDLEEGREDNQPAGSEPKKKSNPKKYINYLVILFALFLTGLYLKVVILLTEYDGTNTTNGELDSGFIVAILCFGLNLLIMYFKTYRLCVQSNVRSVEWVSYLFCGVFVALMYGAVGPYMAWMESLEEEQHRLQKRTPTESKQHVTVPLLIVFAIALLLSTSYFYLRYRRHLDFFCTRPTICSRHTPCITCRLVRRYSYSNYKSITHKHHLASLKRERLELTAEQTRRSFFDGLIEGRMSRVVTSAYSLSRSSSKRSTFSNGGGSGSKERVFRFGWKDGNSWRGRERRKTVEDIKFDEALMSMHGGGQTEMVDIPKAAYAAYSFCERGGSITDPSYMMGGGRGGVMGREEISMRGGGGYYDAGDPGPLMPCARDYTPLSPVACPGAWVRSPMDAVPRLPSMNLNHEFSVFDEYGDE